MYTDNNFFKALIIVFYVLFFKTAISQDFNFYLAKFDIKPQNIHKTNVHTIYLPHDCVRD